MHNLFYSQKGGQVLWISGKFIAAFWLALTFMLLPIFGYGQAECPAIKVKIGNVGNNAGVIACAIFESPEGFPDKFLQFASRIMLTQIKGKDASFEFSDIETGGYAMAVIHDENHNGKLDKQRLGYLKKVMVYPAMLKS